MKKLAKLVVFFSLSFVLIFAASAGLRFLALRVEWVRTIPQGPETALASLISAAYWALSLALYGSLLLSLSYAARQRVFAPVSALCLCALSLAAGFGVFTALEHWEQVPAAANTAQVLGGPGLILTNSLSGNETAVVLLKGPANPAGARVVAIPGRILFYQGEASAWGNVLPSLPPVPFRNETPWFLRSLAIDIRLSAEQLGQRYRDGIVPFLIYAGALIFCLSSLRFLLKLSAWPLANLFLGCLGFRGILALETFFNSPDMQDVFDSFLQNRLAGSFAAEPLSLATPLIFAAFGLLAYVYSILVYLATRRGKDED
jgi:hypothetical protein